MSSEHEELIDELREIRKSKSRSRMLIGFLFLMATSVPIGLLAQAAYTFYTTQAMEVVGVIAEEAMVVAQHRLPDVQSRVDRVGKTYIAEFQKVADRDLESMQKELFDQLKYVSDYAGSKWGVMQERVDALAERQESVLFRRLNELLELDLPPEELRRLQQKYAEAVSQRLIAHWRRFYDDHKVAIDKLETGLMKASRREPDLMRIVAGQEAAGMVLEFAGLELQSQIHRRGP
jgi:hypothetical protein